MNKKFPSIGMWGSCFIMLALLLVYCTKSSNLSPSVNNSINTNDAGEGIQDVFAYYLSAADNKLYVAEAYKDRCSADLNAEIISSGKWMISLPNKNDKQEVALIVQGKQSFGYTNRPNPGDMRNRPGFKCITSVPASSTCEAIINVRAKSIRRETVAYTKCKKTIPTDLCVEVYSKIGTATAYAEPQCTGAVVGSVDTYGWACAF